MGTFKFTSSVLGSLIRLLFFTLFTSNLTASNPLQDKICKVLFCGEGTCQGADNFLGVDCKCNPGWTKFNVTSLPCVIPNCTINFQCGNGPPSTSLQLPASPLPASLWPASLPNISDPCLINFCGLDGTCESNGSDFKCQCFEGSTNLRSNPKFPCFKKCYLGADCNSLDLGFNQPPPPSPPPPPANSGPQTTGDMLNGLGKLHVLSVIVLAALFLR